MYSPKFSYTDKLISNLVKLEGNKTLVQVQSNGLPYDSKTRLLTKTKTIAIFHVAHMLKCDLTLKDAERIATGSLPNIDDPEKRDLLTNFRNAIEFNRSDESGNYGEFDKSILLQLNKEIITNWRESWDAKYRNFNEKIDTRWDDFAGLRDMELKAKDLDLIMNDLVEWYKYSVPTLTPVMRIAIAFYRLIEICPFIAANKISFLAILDYLFIKNSYSSKYYSVIIESVDLNDEEYINAFKLSQKNHDLTMWIEKFVELLNKEFVDLRESLTSFIEEDEKSKKQPFLDLNKRQLKILKYLQTVPIIKREDYCHLMDVSTMTAFRDLNDLVRKKLLRIEGQGRGTKYKLSSM